MHPVRICIRVGFVFLLLAVSSPTCEWTYLIWIPRSPLADPLYLFKEGDKVGYIDQTGKIVVPPVISGGGEFHDGLLENAASSGVYLDRTGKKAINKQFYRGWAFSEGLAVAMETEGGKWGYINTKGDFAISPRFASSPRDYVWPFEGGFAKIEIAGKYGYIDHIGALVVDTRFLDGDSFHDGLARVVVEGPCLRLPVEGEGGCGEAKLVPPGANEPASSTACKFTYVDKTGKIISEQRFDSALPFSEGLAPVRIGKLWGYINTAGIMVIPARFNKAQSFSEGLGLVSENGLFGYVDHQGHFVIQPQFKNAENFTDGRAVIGDQNTGFWYIDTSGKQAIPGKFLLASPFFKGIAHVKVLEARSNPNLFSGTYAYIDTSGRRIFAYTSKN
jgi:hypothetical protein